MEKKIDAMETAVIQGFKERTSSYFCEETILIVN